MGASIRHFDPYHVFMGTFLDALDLESKQFNRLADDPDTLMNYAITLETSYHNAIWQFQQIKQLLTASIPRYANKSFPVKNVKSLMKKGAFMEIDIDNQGKYEEVDWELFLKPLVTSRNSKVQKMLEDSVDVLNKRIVAEGLESVTLDGLVDSCKVKYDSSKGKTIHMQNREKQPIQYAFCRVGRLPSSFVPRKASDSPVHYLFKGRLKNIGSVAMKSIRSSVEYELISKYLMKLIAKFGYEVDVSIPKSKEDYVVSNDNCAFSLVTPFNTMVQEDSKLGTTLIQNAVTNPILAYVNGKKDIVEIDRKFGCIYSDVLNSAEKLGMEHQATYAANYFYHHLLGPINHARYELNRMFQPSPGFMRNPIIQKYMETTPSDRGKDPGAIIEQSYARMIRNRIAKLEHLCNRIVDTYETVPESVSAMRRSIGFYNQAK